MMQMNIDGLESNDEALEIETLRADVSALAEYNNELQETISVLSEENSVLYSTVNGLSEQNSLLQSNIDAITEQNSILQSALSEQNRILQTGVNDLLANTDALIEQNDSLNVQVEKLQFTCSIFLCFLVLYTVYAIGKKAYKILSSFF